MSKVQSLNSEEKKPQTFTNRLSVFFKIMSQLNYELCNMRVMMSLTFQGKITLFFN